MTSQAEFQRQTYDRHYPKRLAATREQFAHPLFRSFQDRLAIRVLDLAPQVTDRPLRIIDVGCGEGLLAAGVARVAAIRQTPVAYTGADLSEGALGLAREAVPSGVQWLNGDAEEVLRTQADDSHDVVVFKNLLHHVSDPAALLTQASRVVGPEGRVVVVEARLGCPQFLVFSGLAPRRERYFFSGARRNLSAMRSAGLHVVHTERFSWLPYELAFAIRFRIFRRLFSTHDARRIAKFSRADDRLAASPVTGLLASYVVWGAKPIRTPGSAARSASTEGPEGSKSR